MQSSLSDNPRNSYAPMELAVFDILWKSKKPLTLEDIAKQYYKKSEGLPFHWTSIIRGTITTLMKRMELNKEKLRIEKIKTQGEKKLQYKLKEK